MIPILILILSACLEKQFGPTQTASDPESQTQPTTNTPSDSSSNPGGQTITACDVQKKIFGPNCVQCHGAMGRYPHLDSNSVSSLGAPYIVAKDPSSSKIYQVIASGRMPPKGKLSQEDIDYVKSWIEQGAVAQCQ